MYGNRFIGSAATTRCLSAKYPAVSDILLAAEEDVIAHMAFPVEHWTKIASTTALERVNKEIKRRTDVVGIFPNRASARRLCLA